MITIIDYRDRLPKHSWKKWPTRKLDAITGLCVHHTAQRNRDDCKNYERAAAYHVSKGKPGVCYHFGIEPDGTIKQGLELTCKSRHSKAVEKTHIGVLVCGDFSGLGYIGKDRKPTDDQVTALGSLIYLLERGEFTGFLARHLDIGGHRDYSPTICPGDFLLKWIAAFRNNWNYELTKTAGLIAGGYA